MNVIYVRANNAQRRLKRVGRGRVELIGRSVLPLSDYFRRQLDAT